MYKTDKNIILASTESLKSSTPLQGIHVKHVPGLWKKSEAAPIILLQMVTLANGS